MKKLISLLLVLGLCASFCACSQKSEVEPTAEPTAEPTVEPELDGANIVNPMVESDPAGILAETGLDLSFLSEYENAKFFVYNTDLKLAEARFDYEGKSYSYRMAAVADSTDISGIYYAEPHSSEEMVDYNSATLRSENGTADISWFDLVPGIQYDLSCSENADEAALLALANKLFAPAQGDAEGDNAGFMQDALARMQQGYHPGSAGSSLTGAANAAAFADLFTEVQPSAEDVQHEVTTFAATLSTGDQVNLAMQLLGLKGSFEDLAQNGIDILETAGATAAHYPWDNATIATLFAAMGLKGSEYAYAQRLSDYANAVREGKSWEELTETGLSYMVHDLTLDTIGFTFEDLDNDGIAELILGAIAEDDYLKALVLELDTVDMFGQCSQVFMSGERDRLYTVEGDRFNHQASSSAFDSLDVMEQYKDGALTVLPDELGEHAQRNLSLLSTIG